MTKSPRSRSPNKPIAPDFESLIESNGANVEAFNKASQSVMEGFAKMNLEMVAFGQRRLQENVDHSRALMRCHNLQDACQAQYDYLRTATQQYLDESNQLATLLTNLASRSWMPMADALAATASIEAPQDQESDKA